MSSYCKRCMAPASRCICKYVQPAPLPFELVILQHPLEARHAKNTGRLLWLATGATRFVAEEFSVNSTAYEIAQNATKPALLYPADATSVMAEPHTLPSHLFIIDANWRKAVKMLELNPWLKELPRLAIANSQTQWSIRKAKSEQHLSTIEAVSEVCRLFDETTTAKQLNSCFLNWQQSIEQFRPQNSDR